MTKIRVPDKYKHFSAGAYHALMDRKMDIMNKWLKENAKIEPAIEVLGVVFIENGNKILEE